MFHLLWDLIANLQLEVRQKLWEIPKKVLTVLTVLTSYSQTAKKKKKKLKL